MDPIRRVTPFFSSLRNRFQLAVLILTATIGLQFFLFVEQAGGGGPITIPRPAGVEGFLPIGALLGWKQFLTTGVTVTVFLARITGHWQSAVHVGEFTKRLKMIDSPTIGHLQW